MVFNISIIIGCHKLVSSASLAYIYRVPTPEFQILGHVFSAFSVCFVLTSNKL